MAPRSRSAALRHRMVGAAERADRHYWSFDLRDDDLVADDLVAILLDFVEGRDTSRAAAARAEPLASALAAEDERFVDLETALASYDGRSGRPEPGMNNESGLAFVCRQALHDLGEHRHCQHD